MGKSVMRLGDMSTGHPPFPPSSIIMASSNVMVNKKGAARQGDAYAIHCSPSPPTCHQGTAMGSSTVKVNNMGVHTSGMQVSCGDVAAVGSPNVLAGQ